MKGFKLDSSGDVQIDPVTKSIVMISGDELLRQTVQCVLGTNKGEWFLDEEEGINFYDILGKKPPVPKGENQAEKQYYIQQYDDIKSDMGDIAKKLEKRLDGEL